MPNKKRPTNAFQRNNKTGRGGYRPNAGRRPNLANPIDKEKFYNGLAKNYPRMLVLLKAYLDSNDFDKEKFAMDFIGRKSLPDKLDVGASNNLADLLKD